MLRRSLAAAVAAAGVAILAAPAAEAYTFRGERWPKDRIGYSNSLERYDSAVGRAARAWNAADVGIRFRRVPRAQADVVIRYLRPTPQSGCGGAVPGAGWPGRRRIPVPIFVAKPCGSDDVRALTVAHELGHVIGLGHESRRCALMNPVATRTGGTKCSKSAATVRLRYQRLLEPDDVRGARRLYGGGG